MNREDEEFLGDWTPAEISKIDWALVICVSFLVGFGVACLIVL